MDVVLTPDLVEHLTPSELGERLMRLAYQDAPDERRSWRPGELEPRADTRPWGEEEARAFYRTYLEEDAEDAVMTADAFSFSEQGYDIDYCVFQDGDAVACFAVYQDGELKRALENWDAKKDDRWRDHHSHQAAPHTLVDAFTARRAAPRGAILEARLEASGSEPWKRVFRGARGRTAEEHVREWLDKVWDSESLRSKYDRASVSRVNGDGSREELYEELSPALRTHPSGPRSRASALA